jgi:hypothetical protein
LALAASACKKKPTHETGVTLDLPKGWTYLSKKEISKRGSRVQLMAGNGDRSRTIFLTMATIGQDEAEAISIFGDGVAPRLAAMAVSLEHALPKKYDDFELLDHGGISLAGVGACEIIFKGSERGGDIRWLRIVLAIPKSPRDRRVLMFGFGCPEDEEESCSTDLDEIESSWRWP